MAGAPKQPQTDDPFAPIAIILGITFLLVMFWLLNDQALYYGAGKMAYYMLWPFSFIDSVQTYRLSIVREIMNPPDVGTAWDWTTAAWRVPSTILAGFALYLAWRVHKHPIATMKGKISVDALLRYQATVHSPIAPIVPIAKDLHKNLDPRWHEPYHPHEYVKLHNLANEDGTLDWEKVEKVFLKQLGTRVFRPGIDKSDTIFADRLNNYEKAIFALLAPLAIKIKDGMPEYNELMDALNYSAVNPKQKPNLALANKLYQQYRTHPQLNNLFRAHHFSVTYLMQLYILAKRAGKITTSHWVGWLRPNANELYAALNTAGRATPFAESAGAFAQWKLELHCQRHARMPIIPAVAGAVKGLDEEWEFWSKATQGQTDEALWGRMTQNQSALDQELFRRYVTDVLAPKMSAPPTAGEDSLFDQQQSQERREREEQEMTALMAGLAKSFSVPLDQD